MDLQMYLDRFPRLKQYAIIAGFIVLVLILATALYLVFFKSTSTPGQANTNNTTITGLPNINDILGNVNIPPVSNSNLSAGTPIGAIANGGSTQVQVITPDVRAADVAPAVTNDPNGARYYNSADGKFYHVNTDGAIQQIGTGQFPNASNVTWSGVSNQVIVEFPDGSNIFYDIATNKQVTLPKEFEEFAFAPDGNQIAFKYMNSDPDKRVFAVSSPDGSSARTLESLGDHANRLNVTWSPTGKIAGAVNEFIDANRQEIGFVGLNNENFKGTVVQGRGFNYQYSASGQQMLYSTYSAANDYKPRLQIVNADGDTIGDANKDLGINTFADKCAFSKDSTSVYCAVPTEEKFGSGLDRRALDGVPDQIIKIDLNSGLQNRVALPTDSLGKSVYSVTPNSMIVTGDKNIIFQDKNTNQLVKLQLP